MRTVARIVAGLIVIGSAAFWFLTGTTRVTAALPPGDPAAGAVLYHVGGCASCHAAPDAGDDAKDVLSGGLRIESDFGTFVVPNISPHPEAGIGGWSVEAFASAMRFGTRPNGGHYYPAFPYTSYRRMTDADLADLYAYMMTELPASDAMQRGHEVGFPFNVSRGIGLWKRLHLDPAPVIAVSGEVLERGRYLVEGPGHCGECHTPRTATGGLDTGRWLAGGPNPDGDGQIPNITPGGRIGDWSEADIAYYLESGFTPDYDSVGGSMVSVVENLSRIPAEDRAAIAAYLKAVPALEGAAE